MSSNATNLNWGKAWAGRFAEENNPLMERFNSSISFDIRLWKADIDGNCAWAAALQKAGIISREELRAIENGLTQIRDEFEKNEFQVHTTDEDIHMAIERRLTELIGETAGKLHTGRSRNDQVVTDFRIFLKQEIQAIRVFIQHFQTTIVKKAQKHLAIILPGYTHLQPAQPILLAHYWLSFFFALQRDTNRLRDCYRRMDTLPLGSGALAGSAFPIDRKFLADRLGFSRISENSLDAVSDRDFVLEFMNTLTQIQIHLSRYAEDLIIWSSGEFQFIELDDAWATGSSMMPQKKNPDSLELIRGKAARLIGGTSQLLALMKGLPLTYAKDLQEDKSVTFEALDAVKDSLMVFNGVIESLKIHPEKMKASLNSMLLATDLADYLVMRGKPFRQSHNIVGQVVRWALEKKCSLAEVPLETYQRICDLFDSSVFEVFSWEKSISRRNLPGGTGTEAVKEQIFLARQLLNQAVSSPSQQEKGR